MHRIVGIACVIYVAQSYKLNSFLTIELTFCNKTPLLSIHKLLLTKQPYLLQPPRPKNKQRLLERIYLAFSKIIVATSFNPPL